MWTRTKPTLFLLFFTLILSACNSEETPNAEEDLSNVPFTRNVAIDTSLIIVSRTVNSCDWKSIMETTEEARLQHGIVTRAMYRGLVDTNLVLILNEVTDLEMARAFTKSEKQMAPITQQSIDKEPEAIFLDQELEYKLQADDTLVMYMSFKTLAYSRWEDAFLADFREDASKEFEVLQVFRGIDEPNQVHMIFKVNDPQYVEKMEKNNAFKMKMLAAGVVSYPVTYKLSPM